MRKNIPTLCVDTNVIIHFTELATGNNRAIKDMREHGNLESMKVIYNLFERGKIRLIVPPTVYREIVNGFARCGERRELNFMKNNNFYVFDIPEKKKADFNRKVFELAKTYSAQWSETDRRLFAKCNRVQVKDVPQRIFTPLSEQDGQIIPQHDAMIMAEASAMGFPLLTENTHDFIQGYRASMVRYINDEKGLSKDARPISTFRFSNTMINAPSTPFNLGKHPDKLFDNIEKI